MRLRIFFAADDGGAAGASVLAADTDAGQVTEAAAPEAAASPASDGAAAQQAAAPFLSHGGRDFASAEEVIAHMDRGTLSKQDYDQKMREFAENQRRFESERTSHSAQLEKAQAQAAEYDRIKQAINANPQAQQLWRQALTGQPTAQGIRQGAQYDAQQLIEQAREQWEQQNAPMREWYESQQRQQQREAAIGRAAELVGPNFDREFVDDAINQLTEIDTEEDDGANYVTTLAVLFARARAGASASGAQAPASPPPGTRRPSGGASQPAGAGAPKFGSPSELAAAQKAAIANGTPQRVLFKQTA